MDHDPRNYLEKSIHTLVSKFIWLSSYCLVPIRSGSWSAYGVLVGKRNCIESYGRLSSALADAFSEHTHSACQSSKLDSIGSRRAIHRATTASITLPSNLKSVLEHYVPVASKYYIKCDTLVNEFSLSSIQLIYDNIQIINSY